MDNNFLYTQASDYSTGKLTNKVPNVSGAEFTDYFTITTEGNDFVTVQETSNGQSITCLVIDPTTDDKRSTVTQNPLINVTAHIASVEMSMNQRIRHQYGVMELSTTENITPYTDYTISTLQQATTTLTLTMASNVLAEWSLGDWINISGCADNRINYPNFVIASISANGLVVTGTVSDEATIPSLTVGPLSTVGMIATKKRQILGKDGYGMRFSGTSATASAYLTKFGQNITKVTGTLIGTQTVTNGSSAPVFANGATGQVDIRATTRYFMRSDDESLLFYDRASDSSAITSTRNFFSSVKPAWQKQVVCKYSAVSPKSMVRPITKIISAVKTGTTTATITTDVPHGLTTSNYVTIKGIRDTTNFPALTTATVVASTPTTTTFTIVIGGAVTATSYGGSVIIANGQVDQPGIIGQVVQSINVDATNGFVTLVGSASWAGLNIREFIYLHGCRNATTGADLGYDGAWEVITLNTTTLVVRPVFTIYGVRVSPALSTLGTTNCGGTVILMTTFRAHDSVFDEYSPNITRIEGQGTQDITKAIPTYPVGGTQAVSGTVTATANQNTAVALSATGTGAWYIRSAIAGIADIASGAITTTTTTASIANDLGNSFQVTIPVTVVSGTTPTMDVRVEESFDGGTNWVTLYEFQRITATGSYNSPILRATGRNVRYVQTIAGTTPSFTRAITRNVLPFHNAEPQKRIIDRTVVPNTINSTTPILFSGASNNIQLVVNMGAITTTAPQFQIEGSEDGVNFYSIGTPLTAVPSSTVQLTITDASATFTRARVSTAGSGATLGYVSLKSFS